MCPVAPAKHWGDGEPGLRYMCDLEISMVGPGISFGVGLSEPESLSRPLVDKCHGAQRGFLNWSATCSQPPCTVVE